MIATTSPAADRKVGVRCPTSVKGKLIGHPDKNQFPRTPKNPMSYKSTLLVLVINEVPLNFFLSVWSQSIGGLQPSSDGCPLWFPLPYLLCQPNPTHHNVQDNCLESGFRCSRCTSSELHPKGSSWMNIKDQGELRSRVCRKLDEINTRVC